MFQLYEPNPVRTGAIDCSTRALAKALNISWEKAYALKYANGFQMGNEGVADEVWGSVLRQHGFRREIVPNTCPDCYTVADFCEDHPHGVFVVKSENHVATVVDGVLFDSWDSSMNVPQYYWTKGDKK